MSTTNTFPKTILLADDDSDDCMIFEEALREIDKETLLTIANDGQQLMQKLEETTPSIPDVIFLDLNMPRKNGAECLMEIRSTPKFKDIPVVIFSTSNQQKTVDEMYNHGASLYICKPNEFSKMKDIIGKVLSLSYKNLIGNTTKENFFLSFS